MIKENWRVFILFVFINALVSLFFNYFQAQEVQVMISNGLYTPWRFSPNTDIQLEAISTTVPENTRIFVEINGNQNVRVLYRDVDINWETFLHAGRMFDGNNDSGYAAVVGRGVYNRLAEDVFVIGGTNFEVIGVLGMNYFSSLDHIVLLSDFPFDIESYQIVIDSADYPTMISVADSVEGYFFNNSRTTSALLGNEFLDSVIITNMILIISIILFITCYIFSQICKERNGVYRLLGRTENNIFSKNMLLLMLIQMSSLFLVLFVEFILNKNNFRIDFLLLIIAVILVYSSIYWINNIKERWK